MESSNRAGSATSTSNSLIVRLQTNEAKAWGDVVRLYSPLVYHWCRRAGLPEQECPDVVQEVFRSTFLGIAGFRRHANGGTFRGWLRTIARNKVVDFYRRKGKQPDASGGSEAAVLFSSIADVDDDTSADESDLRAEHALYQRAFEMIRHDVMPQTWEAFRRVVVDGKDAATVAEELDMQPGAVRVAKSRVLRRLREQLGDLLE